MKPYKALVLVAFVCLATALNAISISQNCIDDRFQAKAIEVID